MKETKHFVDLMVLDKLQLWVVVSFVVLMYVCPQMGCRGQLDIGVG